MARDSRRVAGGGPVGFARGGDRADRRLQLGRRGAVKTWYPRGVSTRELGCATTRERFDTVEVDSPYYAPPRSRDVTGRWAQRTPPEFRFHVKAAQR